MDKPLSDRKNILKDKLKERIASRLLNPFPKTERLITAPAVEMGLEGIMGKREASVYQPGIRILIG